MRRNWMWGLSLLLVGSMVSCRTTQSAYKAAYEKAQENKTKIQAQEPDLDFVVIESQDKQSSTKAENAIQERREYIKAVDSDDNLLKSYNVIVGSFRQKGNAKSLCERLQTDGYPAVLVQNAEGMYRVVACSFDDRDSAVEARLKLQDKYPHFKDIWFLIKK